MKRRKRELCFWISIAIGLLTTFGLTWCTAVEYAGAPPAGGSSPEYDLGDAPDSSQGSGGLPMRAYPDGTVASFPTIYGSGSPPYGPIHWRPTEVAYLGSSVSLEAGADDGADDDFINNIRPLEQASNRDGGDDAIRLPLALPSGEETSIDYTVTVADPARGVMYVNVWFDWNRDGDWDDILNCSSGATAPEWAVQNQVVTLTAAGRLQLTTPSFVCWHPSGSEPAPIWMRITLSESPWLVLGQGLVSGGSGPNEGYLYGETEDYYLSPERSTGAADYQWLDRPAGSPADGKLTVQAVTTDSAPAADSAPVWVQSVADPDYKASQWPEMTTDGIGIRVDNSDGQRRVLADDFECTSTNFITGVRLWGVWQDNQKGQITRIRLRLHEDAEGKPAPEIPWQREFVPTEFEVLPYYVQADAEWWSDPLGGLEQTGGPQLWEIKINIPIGSALNSAFKQLGQSDAPRRYWLAVMAETTNGQFGWQTRQQGEQSLGAAVWVNQSSSSQVWQELRYPPEHPLGTSENTSVDLAFCLMYTAAPADGGALTSQPGSSTYCSVVSTRCPSVSTRCPAVSTRCPETYTNCPPTVTTRCPAVSTKCPTTFTRCPVSSTNCPVSLTRCPATLTICRTGVTVCPASSTRCPVVSTKCPTSYTKCPVSSTRCPVILTKCPEEYTKCPTWDTRCPVTYTKCPVSTSKCPPVLTLCNAANTKCPEISTRCPPISTKCPPETTHCPLWTTHCPTSYTHCPVNSTYCPVNTTYCPVSYTKCPHTSTKCPVTPVATICPTSTTHCPAVYTNCPTVSTKCPTSYTHCPTSFTKCPTVTTVCPVSATHCPPVPTACPTVTTVCPLSATHCPPVPTLCPSLKSICPPTFPFCLLEDGSGAPVGQASSPTGRLIDTRSLTAQRTFVSDALLGGCPTVETTAPLVVADGQ